MLNFASFCFKLFVIDYCWPLKGLNVCVVCEFCCNSPFFGLICNFFCYFSTKHFKNFFSIFPQSTSRIKTNKINLTSQFRKHSRKRSKKPSYRILKHFFYIGDLVSTPITQNSKKMRFCRLFDNYQPHCLCVMEIILVIMKWSVIT